MDENGVGIKRNEYIVEVYACALGWGAGGGWRSRFSGLYRGNPWLTGKA
jgi:hypothetical protein